MSIDIFISLPKIYSFMVKNYNGFLQKVLFLLFVVFSHQTFYAQCAGDDASLTVCDIPDPANQSINLFSLIGSANSGGTWNDDDSSGGLNATSGVLNAHAIRQSGIYRYTYTVSGAAGCTDNSATVTVTIGGYAGKPSPTATVCSEDSPFNLFQAFDSAYLSPHSNGQWHNDTTNQNISGSVINVKDLEGTYQFTYTMPAIGTCPSPPPSTVFITVFQAPKAGDAQRLTLCASNGLSAYTNYDLFSLISGQDPGGTWVDNSNTGELNFKGDHEINIEKIYNSFGSNEYSFSYRVNSTNPICPNKQATVVIRLEEKLDFTGAVVEVNSDICESEITTANYTVTITRGATNIPNGSYYVRYSVSGPRAATETVLSNFNNGVLTFPLRPDFFQQVGVFKVNILDIYAFNSRRACQNIINNLSDDLIIYPNPDLEGAVLTSEPTCQNKDAIVHLSNAIKLADGDYNIIYNVTGANTAFSQVARITVTGGNADFIVPDQLNSRSGTSVIRITAITHIESQCVSGADVAGNIIINPLPNFSALTMQIASVCFGRPVQVTISGFQALTDVTLSYQLSGQNTSPVQTIDLNPVNGIASFVIPSALLPNSGSSAITITNYKNNTTGCDIDVTGKTGSFILHPIPTAPAAANQSFCKADEATVLDLQPQGVQYKWYISETAATPLPDNYLLKSEDYFVKETSPAGCVSEASKITVTINDVPAPVLIADGQNFCGLDNPTILNLSNNTNSPSTVVWYDAAVNGNVLPSSTPLSDRTTYYGFDFSNTENCISYENLAVTVSLIDCNSQEYAFFVPDGFSPNGDGINDTFIIPDIDFLYPDYTIEIFNRYGNGMYKGHKNKPGWDGMNYEQSGLSGGIAPNGVYFYVLNFNKNNKPPQQGRIYLNR